MVWIEEEIVGTGR